MDQMNMITKKVDVLPMVKYYMAQLGVYGLFAKYVPKPKQCPVDPAQILSILVANIVCASQPLLLMNAVVIRGFVPQGPPS
jgi:hypothetical protein